MSHLPRYRPRIWLAALAVTFATNACRLETDVARSRPNVVLITIETLRADHVGSHGYARNTTPNLDRLAAKGAQFTNAVAQAPFTLPSVTSLMTGLYPASHGVRNHPATLSGDIATLAEQFQRLGYRTAAMTRHTWLRRKSGLDRGFDDYHNNRFSAGLDARSLSLAALDWMSEQEPGKPFFLWVHFLDPHLPYTPSYPYSVLFNDRNQGEESVVHLKSMVDQPRDNFEPTPYADLSGGPYHDLVLRHYPDNPILLDLALWRRSRGSIFFNQVDYDPLAVQQMRDLYDGAILYTDDNIGRIVNGLEGLGIINDTLLAVTSDHGEALGEHDLYFTHDFTLYDEVLRVPMILNWPGRIPPGLELSQQVRLMDLFPTLLELADAPPVGELDAVSLAPLLEDGGALAFQYAFAENAPFRRMFPEQERVYFEGNRGKWRAIRTERWKLILIPHPQGNRFELYDLVNDPRETRNLYEDLPGEAARLMPLLMEWVEKDLARNQDKTDAEQDTLEGLDPAAEQQLKTLGYIR